MSEQLPGDVPAFDGEVVLLRRWANRKQSRFRAAGGRLYVTNVRVLFCPHAVDSALDGEYWHAPLDSIVEVGKQKWSLSDAAAGGLRTRLKITTDDGTADLFVVNKLDAVIAEIQSAIRAA